MSRPSSGTAPDRRDVLEQVAAQDPEQFRLAHNEGHPRRYDWIKACAWALHKIDPKFGLNGKRGNANDISMDIITYRIGPTDRHVQCFDVCGQCGGSGAYVKWDDITDWATKEEGGNPGFGEPGTAIWVKPEPFGEVVVQPDPNTRWTEAHNGVAARFLTDYRQPNPNGDTDFVRALAQQLKFSFPGEEWGTKSTSSTSPVSNNVLALKVGQKMYGFKVVPSPTGTPSQLDISTQFFRPVEAQNYLKETPVDPPPVNPPNPPVDPPKPPVQELTDVLSALKVLVEENQKQTKLLEAATTGDAAALTAALTRLSDQLDRGFVVKVKGGWPIGDVNGGITLKG